MNGLLHLQGQNDRVTRTGIKFDDLFAQFIFHPENDPCKKSSLVDVVDKNSLDRGFQAFQNQPDQIMSERTLLLDLIHRHVDCVPDRWIDVDYKGLVFIAQKDSATIGSGHYALYGDLGRVIIHLVIIVLVAFIRKHLYPMFSPLNPKNKSLPLSNLYLIGFMGTGKTAVGEMTARKLGLRFVDSDQEIARNEGRDIAAIFEQSGEKRFREMELKFILEGHPGHGCLVSCGGGLPIAEGMLEKLKRRGMVITLWASPETIFERTKGNSTRPLLQVDDPLAEITRLLKSREATYLGADQVISTEMRSAKSVSELIARAYESHKEKQSANEN